MTYDEELEDIRAQRLPRDLAEQDEIERVALWRPFLGLMLTAAFLVLVLGLLV